MSNAALSIIKISKSNFNCRRLQTAFHAYTENGYPLTDK